MVNLLIQNGFRIAEIIFPENGIVFFAFRVRAGSAAKRVHKMTFAAHSHSVFAPIEGAYINQSVLDTQTNPKGIEPVMSDLPHEEFWVLFLNRSNQIIDQQRISQGGISGTVTDVRLILNAAVERLASGIILCHNHPSGNLSPSDADLKITKKIMNAAAFLDLTVLDHLILADQLYLSMADDNLMH